ncbi:DUF485 domain-containing protein [Halotalea alkalilenta]|uniref:DUF485 domain-containing protein n=1 Tax=Halotalea alkalilenta TaxID=376489 RepID=A0A172YFR6_9GAMM|nr:DUF485 domain-containing protein [Halotalea alkalilenta]ANF58073.1 hypothetical protein A5892_11840 [Halotalea alkalilenta]
MNSVIATKDNESLAFGLSLTALQMFVYLSFILVSCFHAEELRRNVPIIDLPLSFVFGLAVIVCGTALTIIYVVHANAVPEGEATC